MTTIAVLLVASVLGCGSALHTGVLSDVRATGPLNDTLLNDTDGLQMRYVHDEITEGLYQGDMVLNSEQQKQLLERKITPVASAKWPKNEATGFVEVDYRFADSGMDEAGIGKALQEWESKTCVRFNEIPSANGRPHLSFKMSSGCSSFVGMQPSGQQISLTQSCIDGVGSTVHEIGHALGFNHEQSRDDRDNYVNINFENVQSGRENNFDKANPTLNYDLIYDYGSVMHYGEKYFSNNGQNTIDTKDPNAQQLIGQRVSLSFLDAKQANLHYDCISDWESKCGKSSSTCQYGGYVGQDCNCVCPPGTSGANCEVCKSSYYAAQVTKDSPTKSPRTTEGSISSSGYPTPLGSVAYQEVIIAPECNRVVFTVEDFRLCVNDNGDRCLYGYLEVRTNPSTTANKMCGTDIARNQVFKSDSNVMVLDFVNRCIGTNGFNGNIAFEPIPGCDPATTESASDSSLFFSSKCFDLTLTGLTSTAAPVTTAATTTAATTTAATTTAATTTAATTTAATTTAATTTAATTTAATTTAATTTAATTTAVTTAAPTTAGQTTASPITEVTITNSGYTPLVANNTSDCKFYRKSGNRYYVESPNYNSFYQPGDKCVITFHTAEPRHLRVRFLQRQISAADSLVVNGQLPPRVSHNQFDQRIYLTANSANLTFTAGGRGFFQVELIVVNNDCHQIIEIPEGGSGTIEVESLYPAGTICEWWFRAPEGRQVRLEFTRFFIGGSTCYRDAVYIDRTGDPGYEKSTEHCGGNRYSPGTVTSVGNELNVLLSGWYGVKYKGLSATYSVV